MVNPKMLCRKHLLGEHGEMHKHLPSFRKGHKVDGRFNPVVQIQFQGYEERHMELAIEMISRGYNHLSPIVDIPDFKNTYPQYWDKKVNIEANIKELIGKCPDCLNQLCEWLSKYEVTTLKDFGCVFNPMS